jgi:MYXO-CTERM domain-containing protein
MDYRPASNLNFITGGKLTFDHTADWSSANSRFIWHNGELHLWTTSQDNGFQVLRFTNGVGKNTSLSQGGGGGCATAGGSAGLLAALGALALLRGRRRRRDAT